MAFTLTDRVKQTTTSTGTGPVALTGTVTGFDAFSSVLANNDTTYYCIVDQTGPNWEVGLGTLALPANTLTRTSVLNSSTGGTAVPFTAGIKEVFITYPAAAAVYADASLPKSDVVIPGNLRLTGVILNTLVGAIGIGQNNPTAALHIGASSANASTAPIKLTSGVNLTTPEDGAIEYSPSNLYFTDNTISGRGYVPNTQLFRLDANGASISTTAGNFFGANSAIQLQSGRYEIEAYCYFTKGGTNGTITVIAVSSVAPLSISGTLQYGVGTTNVNGAVNSISFFSSTSTAATFGITALLTFSSNYCFLIKYSVESAAATSNLRINFTNSSGTVTPLRNSYYKVTRLPSTNSGNFVA